MTTSTIRRDAPINKMIVSITAPLKTLRRGPVWRALRTSRQGQQGPNSHNREGGLLSLLQLLRLDVRIAIYPCYTCYSPHFARDC
jgi:hypothetical protein